MRGFGLEERRGVDLKSRLGDVGNRPKSRPLQLARGPLGAGLVPPAGVTPRGLRGVYYSNLGWIGGLVLQSAGYVELKAPTS
jgi:hypothetical protein